MNESGLFAIVVTYNHNDIILSKLLLSLNMASFNIIIVNNSHKKIIVNFNIFSHINNNNNFGLAKAINQGIEKAMIHNPKLIMLFDQDSFILDDQLKLMANEAINIFNNSNVAAIGPSFIEKNVFIVHGFANYNGLIVSAKPSNEIYVDALYLITSGTVINPMFLNKIGLMNENLFIDYVDIEWGLRARSHGYKLLGLNNFKMQHLVGDKAFSFLWFKIPLHSNFRLYYQTRNSILLYKMKHIPFRWKIADLIYFTKRSAIYLIVDYKNIKVIYRAFKDGIKFNA
jgi:rhamnosyltransferase